MPRTKGTVVAVKKKGQKYFVTQPGQTRRKPYTGSKAKAKKVSKKGLNKARRSFEEMKRYTHEDLAKDMGVTNIVTVVDNVTNPTVLKPMVQDDIAQTASRAKILPIWSYYNPKVGFTEDAMIGMKRINKYCKAKMVFNFPQHAQLDNPRYYIVQLWVTMPPNNTNFTTPSKTDYTRFQFLTHITEHISQYFDEAGKREFVNFNPREDKHFKIIKFHRVQPNQNGQEINPVAGPLTATTVNPQVFGKPSQVNLTFNWKCNQTHNTQYTKGTSGAGPIDFLYDNTGWIPALLYYSPDSGDASAGAAPREGTENSPFLYYNDCTWFTG